MLPSPRLIRFVAIAIIACTAPAFAQSFIFVNKERRYTQTGNTTVQLRTDNNSFRFEAAVQSNAAPPVTVTPPGGAARSLDRLAEGGWQLESTHGSQAALDAAFPSGTFTLNISGRSVPVALTGDLYPAPPTATFSQGSFSNGALVIDRTQPLTITINFPQNYAAGRSRQAIAVFGGESGAQLDVGAENDFTTTPLSFTLPANRLVANASYTIELEANRAVVFDTVVVPGSTLVAAYSAFTTVRLTTGTPAPGGGTAPAITTAPRSAVVNAGSTVALTVAATGSPAPTYQWRKDGNNIAGATSDTLVLPGVSAGSAGNYAVVITNSAGSTTSAIATISVVANQPSRLPNLSVRTTLGASQTLIVGFSTAGPKNMLIRAIGPTLSTFGVGGTLGDPSIELYNAASAKIDENNDWSAGLSQTFTDVGAFALVAGSRDAALQRAVSGSSTAQIKGPGSGVVLVEVYDGGGDGKLTNVSARNMVGTGENILIAGFVVDGTAAKTLLIRGVGPKLADFGVPGILVNPKLEIFSSSGVKIAENDNWNVLLQPIARNVGAFDLTPGSADAALVMTIPPGAYTAQISGIGGATGEALVEVYEVP